MLKIIASENEIKPGIYSISNKEYRHSPGISWNAAKLLARTGAHYWNEYLNPQYVPESEKEYSILGNALHTLALESQLFESRFFVMPKLSQKKEDRERKKAIFDELKLNEKIAISEKDAEVAFEMAESLKKTIDLSGLKTNEVEQSLFWENSETGIFCKSRPDILRLDKAIVGDIKTTHDARWRKFKYLAKDYDYPLQAVMFQDALQTLKGITIEIYAIAIESKKPYVCVPYPFSKETLEEGRHKFLKALRTYESSLKNNHWTGYSIRAI